MTGDTQDQRLTDAERETLMWSCDNDFFNDHVAVVERILAARREGPTDNGLRAAIERVRSDHHHADTCDIAMSPDISGTCSCWKADLAAVLAEHAPTEGPTTCECPPCPGRGNDGHGLTHCAECCYGTGVEAEPGCPVHYPLPTEGPTRQAVAQTWRIEVACTGFEHLTDDDVPGDFEDREVDAYCQGAADTARAIRDVLRADRLAATPEDGA